MHTYIRVVRETRTAERDAVIDKVANNENEHKRQRVLQNPSSKQTEELQHCWMLTLKRAQMFVLRTEKLDYQSHVKSIYFFYFYSLRPFLILSLFPLNRDTFLPLLSRALHG